MMEGQETHKKRDSEDNPRGRRKQGGKIRDTQVDVSQMVTYLVCNG